MIDDILESLEAKYSSTINDLKRSLAKLRTGRANLSMLDDIRVEYYGQMSPLNQVATLNVADPRLITIQPWEPDLIPEIEKAIIHSDLGLNPSNDGTVIRVPIPALSGERREELIKVAKKEGEEHKIAIRNMRREANDDVKEAEKESMITEDQMHRAYDKIDALTDKYTSKIDEIVKDKQEEIREV